MSMQEGVGLVPPRPEIVPITRGERALLDDLARRRQRYRRYADRRDQWGRGLVTQPILIGLCGEFALCKYLNGKLGLSLDVDAQDKPRGDEGFDLEPLGLKVQVKTRRRDYGSLLIRRQGADGRVYSLEWQACVCATIASGLEGGGAVEVSLDGWVDVLDVKGDREAHAGFVPAKRGDHMNLEVPDANFKAMRYLVSKIRTHHSIAV